MFSQITARVRSAQTLKALCEGAERHALRLGERRAGAEHFVLAALELEDGTARRAFAAVGADADGFGPAIGAAHAVALAYAGVAAGAQDAPGPLDFKAGVFDAAASGQALMQALAAERGDQRPLVGAHVVAAAAAMEHGVVARALRVMGVDRARLWAAAEGLA
jgi:hypothetical protein